MGMLNPLKEDGWEVESKVLRLLPVCILSPFPRLRSSMLVHITVHSWT
jgi:hypothetical protein